MEAEDPMLASLWGHRGIFCFLIFFTFNSRAEHHKETPALPIVSQLLTNL